MTRTTAVFAGVATLLCLLYAVGVVALTAELVKDYRKGMRFTRAAYVQLAINVLLWPTLFIEDAWPWRKR